MSRFPEKRTDRLPRPSWQSGSHGGSWSPAPDSLGLLRWVLLVLWAATSFGLMYFAQSLQQWVGDLPLSYWLAAQGVILMFVFIVAVYATLANRAEQVQVNFDEVDDD